MNTLKEKKKQAIQMFLLTVKNDLHKWKKKYSDEFLSDVYNDYYFHVITSKNELILKYSKTGGELELSKYKFGIIPFNWKINRSVKKIKRHFRQIEQDKQVQSEINFINNGLSSFNGIFVKDIRKEKLQEINKK